MTYRSLIKTAIVFTSLILYYPSMHAVDITGPELWKKVINYHDPGASWATFKGQVHLVTTNWKERLAGEIITIDKAGDLYQTSKQNETGALVGIRNGKPFATFAKAPTDKKKGENQLKQFRENAFGMKQHHSGHIGMPMQMKVAGLRAQEEVKLVEFQGKICYALTLIGNTDKGPYRYWRGSWTLYVDPETYAMRGALQENKDFPSRYFECLGEIEVEGIKIQQVKNFYLSEDGSHIFTDVYAPAN